MNNGSGEIGAVKKTEKEQAAPEGAACKTMGMTLDLRLSALRTMPVAFLYLLSPQMSNYDAGICKDGRIILDCDFLFDRRWARRYMEYLKYGWKILPKKESGNYTIYTKMFFFVDTGLYEVYNKKAYKRKIDGGI